MKAEDFKKIRLDADLSQQALSQHLGLGGARIVRRYEAGETSIAGPVAILMRLIERDGVDEIEKLRALP